MPGPPLVGAPPKSKAARKNAKRAVKRKTAAAAAAAAEAVEDDGAAAPPAAAAAEATAGHAVQSPPVVAPVLVDIGINIDARDMRGQWEAMAERAWREGVSTMLLTGVSVESARRNIAAIAQYSGAAMLKCTAGVHPHYSKGGVWPGMVPALRALAADPAVVAIGECGLDFNRKLSPHPDQIAVFEAQVALAVELGMPLSAMIARPRETCSRSSIASVGGSPGRTPLLHRGSPRGAGIS
mmetsp:Transcript_9284/g.23860  ORF Transcript_9284/g.23860 Transcript_9284/m.23860 type:complete len:239 (+) Transcript_9284:143-859(+)